MRIILLLSLLIIENAAEGLDEGRTTHHRGFYTICIVNSQIVQGGGGGGGGKSQYPYVGSYTTAVFYI